MSTTLDKIHQLFQLMKLGLIFNIASNYRQGIYQLIDRTFDCEWFFGENYTDIKSMDLHLLKNVCIGKNKSIIGSFFWQQGALRFANRKEISSYLVLGDPFCLSIWVLLIWIKIFHPTKHLYMWTHGWYGKETFVRRILKKLFFKMAKGLFLYGYYAKELMISEGFNPKSLFVIHNSLDYDKQILLRSSMQKENIYSEHFHNHNHTLIFIGRLTKIKKLNLIIEAMFVLRKQGQNFNLVLVGNGEEKENLIQLAKESHLIQSIWFYGASYDEETNARLIFNADLCVSPGNVGLTAMHSLMFGTPVATHNDFKYQMPEFEAIREGITGAFFQKDNVLSIANTISTWFMQKKDFREQIRQNCYQEIDEQWTPQFQLKVLKENLKL